MKHIPYRPMVLGSVFALLLAGGCSQQQAAQPGQPAQPSEPAQPEQPEQAAIANPASEYCIGKGGRLEIVKEEAGEKGMCHLPDGSVVDEWELYRRENPE